jgi:hypothetical protein
MTRMTVLGLLLLASCGGKSGGASNSTVPASVPPGFEVSDTAHWHFGYPAGWTTDESTGAKGEHMLNVRGPQVTPLARCFAFAVWQDNYTQDLVKATRALLVLGEPDQHVITDETFTVAGSKQALRIERTYPDRAKDGSLVQLHAYELHFLRSDNVAIGFDITVPADHLADCQAEQIFRTFTMKAP